MSFAVCVIISILLFAADQFSKLWVINSLKPIDSIKIIDGFLSFTYVENTGAAFGIFQGQKWLLVAIVIVVLCVAFWALYTNKVYGLLERICVTLIIAGGLGNLCDRIRYGFVVDFIDINELFSYPMFNVADCFVVVGAVLMVIAVLFEEKLKGNKTNTISEQGTENADSDNSN